MAPSMRYALLLALPLSLLVWAVLAGSPGTPPRPERPGRTETAEPAQKEASREAAPVPAPAAAVPVRKADGADPAEGPAAMEAVLRLEPASRRREALAARVRAATSGVERELGLHLMAAAGDPEGAWRELRKMFREGSPALAEAAMEQMLAMNPPVFLTEMADALVSPLPAERQVLAVRGLREAATVQPPARMPAASTLAYPGLDNKSRDVRRASLEALGDVGNRVVAPRLREVAATEPDSELSDLAGRAADRSEGR